jgi:hypothetical protein
MKKHFFTILGVREDAKTVEWVPSFVGFLLVLLGLLLVASSAFGQGTSYLERAYFGALYIGSITNDYYNLHNDILPLAAVKTKFSLASGSLRFRLMHDFKTPSVHIWWTKKILFLEFNIGYLPRPIAIINKPEPVSNDANFIPPSRDVIPGSNFGTMGRINFKSDSNLMLGIYKTNKDSVEFNLGFQQDINWFIFRKLGFSCYHSNRRNADRKYINGIALNAEMKRFSLMFFSGRGANSVRTYSGFAGMGLGKNTTLYVSIVHQKEKWQQAEVGVVRLFSEKVGELPTNYLLGVAYNRPQVESASIKVFLQVWLDKK